MQRRSYIPGCGCRDFRTVAAKNEERSANLLEGFNDYLGIGGCPNE